MGCESRDGGVGEGREGVFCDNAGGVGEGEPGVTPEFATRRDEEGEDSIGLIGLLDGGDWDRSKNMSSLEDIVLLLSFS